MRIGHEDLIERCEELLLTDLSEGMLDAARENLGERENITYQQADIQNIPFEDHSFDVVIANSMLYHVPDLEQGLREVRRVLRDGGIFYCATLGEHNFAECLAEFYEDSLHVTDIEDLVIYLQSLVSLRAVMDVPAEKIREILKEHAQDGAVDLPKEYGMFICR